MAGLIKDSTRMSSPLLVSRSDGEEANLMRKRKTHFQQVPVELVKKILERQDVKIEVTTPSVVVENPATKTEPYSVVTFRDATRTSA
jgi:hypothetical protein